jgi:hypothetical protein
MVYWYHDPVSLADPCVGWVCERPGAVTVSLLVFAPGVGFIEKPSVRFKDDPGLTENPSWRSWGCWDYSPMFKELQRANSVVASVALSHDRDSRKTASHGSK